MSTIPVIEVKPEEITQERADFILQNLVGDSPLFKGKDIYTQDEIQDIILGLKLSISDPNSDFNQVFKNADNYSDLVLEKEDEIKTWEEILPNAPETYQAQEVPKKFTPSELEPHINSISGYVATIDDWVANVVISKAGEPFYHQQVTYYNPRGNFRGLQKFSLNTDNLNDVTISLEQARKKAKQFVEELNLLDVDISLEGSAFLIDASKNKYYESPQCFQFFFTRKVNDALIMTYNNQIVQTEAFAEYWPQETISVAVNDNGIVFFQWISPINIVDIVNEDISILPFDEIKDIFERYISINCDYVSDITTIAQKTINISEIKFGYTKVAIKNSKNAWLVPTWSFFGTEIDKYNDQSESGGVKLNENLEYIYEYESSGHAFLIINAIDGGIIDLALGY